MANPKSLNDPAIARQVCRFYNFNDTSDTYGAKRPCLHKLPTFCIHSTKKPLNNSETVLARRCPRGWREGPKKENCYMMQPKMKMVTPK